MNFLRLKSKRGERSSSSSSSKFRSARKLYIYIRIRPHKCKTKSKIRKIKKERMGKLWDLMYQDYFIQSHNLWEKE